MLVVHRRSLEFRLLRRRASSQFCWLASIAYRAVGEEILSRGSECRTLATRRVESGPHPYGSRPGATLGASRPRANVSLVQYDHATSASNRRSCTPPARHRRREMRCAAETVRRVAPSVHYGLTGNPSRDAMFAEISRGSSLLALADSPATCRPARKTRIFRTSESSASSICFTSFDA